MNIEERFWDKVPMREEGKCWLWHGAMLKGGYGQIKIAGTPVQAHRFAWSFVNGEIPEGMVIRHTCDNPSCVNPSHLLLGTHKDNVADKYARHRNHSQIGSDNNCSKLTEADVVEIKYRLSEGEKQKDVAKVFGITQCQVSNIATGKQWGHIDG